MCRWSRGLVCRRRWRDWLGNGRRGRNVPGCIRVWLGGCVGCVRVLAGLGVNRMCGGLFRRRARMSMLHARSVRVSGNLYGCLDNDCWFERAGRARGRMFGVCVSLRIMMVSGRLGCCQWNRHMSGSNGMRCGRPCKRGQRGRCCAPRRGRFRFWPCRNPGRSMACRRMSRGSGPRFGGCGLGRDGGGGWHGRCGALRTELRFAR